MDLDVPWEVNWTQEFERAVKDLKQSGRRERIVSEIEKIIQNPARRGRYKDGTLKGCRTTHIEEKVICWQIKPGVSAELQDQVEEILFLFIAHHDDMGFGISNFSPVEKSTEFQVNLPYYAGFEIERVIHDIFSVAESINGAQVKSPDWRDEKVVIDGTIPPEKRDNLTSVIPESGEIEFDDPSLFD